MSSSTGIAGPRPDPRELDRELERLAALWRSAPEEEPPPGLAGRTVARLLREVPRGGRVVRVDWRVRLGSAAGLAAGLLLGLGLSLWQGHHRPFLDGGLDWAAGLELSERFESPVHETEVRLERLGALLEDPRTQAPLDEAEELRQRLDRAAQEMEVF